MENKLIVGIISVIVVIVVLGSVLIPTVNDSTEKETVITHADKVVSSNTTWAITTDGKLFGCGYNANGQQGDGTTTDVTTFTQRLADQTIKDFAQSGTITWAITTDGDLYGCGNNTYGQQGNGTTTNVTEFTINDDVKSTAIVTKDSPFNELLNAIPLMVIVAVIMMAIALFLVKRE